MSATTTTRPIRRPPNSWAERFGLPHLDRPGAVTLYVATWIDAVGSGLFLTFYLLYLTKAAGFTLGVAGTVLSISSGLALAANPIAGSLIDKIGARRMMLASQIICAAGYIGLLFVKGSIPLLVVASTMAVIGERIFWVGFPSFISIMAPDNERDRWFAFMGMTREAGFGVGGLLAALIVALAGTDGYRILVLLNACSFALAATIIWLRVPSPPLEPVHHDHGGWKAVLRDRPVMKLAVANTVAVMTVLIGGLAMPIYVVDELDLPAWLPGLLFVATTIVLAGGQSIGLRIVTGWLRTRVYLLATAIWVVGAAVFAFAQVIPRELLIPYMFFAIVVTIGGDLFHAPQTNGLPSALAPPALRGRYLALFSLSWGVGRTVAPGIVSGLLWLGPTWPWVGMVVMAGLAAAIALHTERELDPERQRMARSIRLDEPVADDLIEPVEPVAA
jgi:MFS family permease